MSKKIKIYFTSDTHGYVFPIDYATGEKSAQGVIGMGEKFIKDGNTLVIDGGDTIQGSPFTMYLSKLNFEEHPVALAMNKNQYDYVTLGNHDFNYGQDYLNKYIETLDAKVLCGNVDGLPIATSDIKVLKNGLRVGIVGAVTDWINIWENPAHLNGLKVSDPMPAIKLELEKIRDQVDLTICIYHGGYERNIDTDEIQSESGENIAWQICKELDFDLLLTGHQHIPVAGKLVHGTYTVQPANNGVHYLEIDGIVSETGICFTSELKNGTDRFDPLGLNHLFAIEKDVQKWLDEPVGHLSQDLKADEKVTMALNGSPIANFFNQVQLWATGADISAASLGNVVKGFNRSVTVRDVVSTYVYSNTLTVVEINGAKLKQILERASSYLELDEARQPQVSRSFLEPKIEHYNYDFFAGVTYTNTLNQPIGNRVSQIRINGKEITEQDKFTLCINNYRATGAGGYDVIAECPVVKAYAVEMSELIIDYLEVHKAVEIQAFQTPTYKF